MLTSPAGAAAKHLVTVTNWPELFQVREQNVDADGNIKVHEQGTVNVSITNKEPLAVKAETEDAKPKTVKLLENDIVLNNNGTTQVNPSVLSEAIDTEGYRKIIVFVENPLSPAAIDVTVQFEGAYSLAGDTSTFTSGGFAGFSRATIVQGRKASLVSDVSGPKFQVRALINGNASGNLTEPLRVSATAYLIP